MIYNENFALMDEDEDFDLFDEDFDLDDEVLMEGSMELLHEAMTYKVITKPADIDKDGSRKAVQKMKDKVGSMLASGKYREFKGSDKALLAKALKSKEFWSSLGVDSALISQIRWSVFKYEGLTLCSLYAPANKAQAGGRALTKQMVYVVLVKDKGVSSDSKVVFKKLKLKAMPTTTSDRIDL